MKKIMKIYHLHGEEFMTEITNPDSPYNDYMPAELIRKHFGKEISEEIKKFYKNPLNKDKKYNLVLVTDEELNQLEKNLKNNG